MTAGKVDRDIADRDTADRGAATVWAAALVVLVVAATVLAVGGTTAVGARHAAQSAADLAALAAAGRIGVADGDVCAAAGRVAVANGAALRRCDVVVTGARTGEVRVEVARSARWAGVDLDATARARAGRVAAGRRPGRGRRVGRHTPRRPRCGGRNRVAA